MLSKNRWTQLVSLLVVFSLGFSLPLVVGASLQEPPPEVLAYADSVLLNGRVLTADRDGPDFSIAEAVAIRNGRILAVGNNGEVLRFAGPGTVRIDLRGRTVIPGIIANDADNAFAGGDLYKYTQIGKRLISGGGSIRVEPSRDTVLAQVRAYVERASAGEPVFLRFRDEVNGIMWTLTRYDLDPLSPDNPLAITVGGSDVVANTLMLEQAFAAGLRRDHIGVIKDERGVPTGQLAGQAAGVVMWNLRPYPEDDFEQMLENQLQVQKDFVKLGKTTATGHATGLDLTIFNTMYHRGQLFLRMRPGMDFVRNNALASQFLRRVGNLVDFGLGDTVKIVGAALGPADGAIDDPYSISSHEPQTPVPDIIPGDRFPTGVYRWLGEQWTGKSSFDELTPEQKMDTEWQTALEARRYGWNFQGIHNMGSKAAEGQLLAQAEAVNGQRLMVREIFRPHGLDHNVMWNERTMELALNAVEPIRFGLAVREIFSPRTVQGEEIINLKFGDLVPHLQPVKTLIDRGIAVHVEIGERNPFWMMEKVITRKDDKGRLIGPEYAVDRRTALLMATRWAARFIGEENQIGSIERGKLADLVVLDSDYLNMPADDISEIRPLATFIGGQLVFLDDRFAPELGPEVGRLFHPVMVR